MALPAASAAETSSRWCGTLTVTATTSMSGWITSCSWSENTALTPNTSPAARADSALCALSAGMWAVAAQPRTGLTPMIPTPSVDSGIAGADLGAWANRLGGHCEFAPLAALEAQDLVDEDDGDAPGGDLTIDDQNLVHGAADAVRRLGAGILQREGVLVDPTEPFLEV